MIEKTVSYKTKIYQYLKEGIIQGHYKQGESLNERKLSKELGVSRTPIREALQMLAIDGWVVNEPFRETVVRSYDINFVVDAQKVRRALEMLAVEDAVRFMGSEGKERLNQHYQQQEKIIEDYDPVIFMKYDRLFHEEIYQSSHNVILLGLLRNLNDIIRYFGIKVLVFPERSRETIREHKAILDAILEGNTEKAKAAMDYHLTMTEAAILKESPKKE